MHEIKKYIKEIQGHKNRILCNVLSKKLVNKLSDLSCDFFVFTQDSESKVELGSNVFVLPQSDVFPLLSYDAMLLEYQGPEDAREFKTIQEGFNVPMLSIFNFPFSAQNIQSQELQNAFKAMAGTISIVPDENSVIAMESLGLRAIAGDVYETNILQQILIKEDTHETSN
jgi:hypothetical protein